MLTKNDRRRRTKEIESLYKRRAFNLATLAEMYGGWVALARKCGVSAAYLCAVAGPNPTKPLHEKGARNLEETMGLPFGYLDKTHRA